ncbi:MFS transporter [Halopseudomonas salegens]|uniref:1-acyl-sn-glycerol-3-phosphate acyltransferases n=1 Tax=Halopseudomonas salegens TaxID=1434072 RepID=A0A1H2G540_9GAMM|nr:MFS transporter [Halopseudomonas salegens]SDU14659.1 1-acyl-sn-glycerol-3-phosphate acyltransferases [Halopseudomonas salegens]
MSQTSQFELLRSRRFLPFFLTQLLGAFNDNVFKQALVLAILYKLTFTADRDLLINLAAMLFILPFFLFSALGGQFGEKFAKERLIRLIKFGEVLIMLVGAASLLLGSLPLMLAVLFATGVQSALFGPVKYSILPQHLNERELLGGNALVEMGTFLAILGGTLYAGILMSGEHWAMAIGITVVLIAVLGLVSSLGVPRAHAGMPELKLDWNIMRQSWRILHLGLAQQMPSVSRSLLGNSWFWFIGAIYLTQIPGFAKDHLHGDESVVTLILTLFSVGIAMGSLLCERMSGRRVEIGLVPFGAFGLTLFGILIWWFSAGVIAASEPYSWLQLLAQPAAWWVLLCLFGLGLFGGFYIVPLYALIQSRTPEHERSRVIAANNILNALLMVLAAVVSILMLTLAGLSIPQLFLVVALMNIAVCVYIFTIVPEFTMRFLIWLLGHSMYRVTHENLEAIPDEGPCLLVCNHVSFVDAVLIGGAVRRPVRFVMYHRIYNLPVLNFIFRTAGAVPIAPRSECEQTFEQAFQRIGEYLAAGEVVCIFPEGKLTADGDMNPFRDGCQRILESHPVPVIPMALRGLWGSFFSRAPNKGLFRRFWSRVALVAADPLTPQEARTEVLQASVSALRGEAK